MKQHQILSENSEHHWTHTNSKGTVLLDLGCGRHDTSDLYQSSAIYLGESGATKVIGVDIRNGEIDYFNSNNPDPNKYTFICKGIYSSNDIRELLTEYNPTAIKCDIEEYEVHFYDLSKEEMANIIEFSLEYHSLDIRENMIQKLNEWGFNIHTEGKFAFVSAPQMGVLFCSR
jgi:hypothetical protein